MKQKNKKWYGFTEDKVFGWVMADEKFCKFMLQTILPEIRISNIHKPGTQKEFSDPINRKNKDIRVDVIVEDDQGNLYDLEMQTSSQHDLGRRMRYYSAKMDQRYTLKKGNTYRNLKKAFIIFLCPFDPIGKGKMKYVFRTIEKSDRTIILPDGIEKIIINSKGDKAGASKELLALTDLMNDKKVNLNKLYDSVQAKIKQINSEPALRDAIMDLQTKLDEERAAAQVATALSDANKSIKRYLSLGVSKSEILKMLLEDYNDVLYPEEIEQLVAKAR